MKKRLRKKQRNKLFIKSIFKTFHLPPYARVRVSREHFCLSIVVRLQPSTSFIAFLRSALYLSPLAIPSEWGLFYTENGYILSIGRYRLFLSLSPIFIFYLYHCITVSERVKRKDKQKKNSELHFSRNDTKLLIQLFCSCITSCITYFFKT